MHSQTSRGQQDAESWPARFTLTEFVSATIASSIAWTTAYEPWSSKEFVTVRMLINSHRLISEGKSLDKGGDSLVLKRTIDAHTRSLRKKLGPHAVMVETVRGIGYRLRDPSGVK